MENVNEHTAHHPLFKERSFSDACETVIGACNGVPFTERWQKETPLFAEAILRNLERQENRILDYGTGVGRIAKAILEMDKTIQVNGVDDSPVQLEHARRYAESDRFQGFLPHECTGRVDLVYCVYVLQHIPAIAVREALARMHYWLRPGGTFVCCTSYCRMAPRYSEKRAFFDDRLLGVNLRAEIERLFEPVGDLFTPEELKQNEVVRRMIEGHDGRVVPIADGSYGTAHPAIVYRRREISGTYFDQPMPAWFVVGE